MAESIVEPTSKPSPEPPELYDAAYYAHYSGEVYEHNERWLTFFGGIADRIIAEIAPHTSLDVGCAYGLLVETLRDRGVDAKGFDISEYAISQVREDIRPYCWVGSILQPIEGRYDVITCVEVLEHLTEQDANTAIGNLCAATDDILFTSTPFHYREETHINVRPPEYWAARFARHGFVHDFEFDGTFLAPWAIRFRRSAEPTHRIVSAYERECWRLRNENNERHALVLDQMREINQFRNHVGGLESELHHQRELAAQLSDAVAGLEVEAERLRRELATLYRLRAIVRRIPLGTAAARRLTTWVRRH